MPTDPTPTVTLARNLYEHPQANIRYLLKQIAGLNQQLDAVEAERNSAVIALAKRSEGLAACGVELDRLKGYLVRIANKTCAGKANDACDALRSILLDCNAALEDTT